MKTVYAIMGMAALAVLVMILVRDARAKPAAIPSDGVTEVIVHAAEVAEYKVLIMEREVAPAIMRRMIATDDRISNQLRSLLMLAHLVHERHGGAFIDILLKVAELDPLPNPLPLLPVPLRWRVGMPTLEGNLA